MEDHERVKMLEGYQSQPLICSYIGAPCAHVGTVTCSETATITCRNIRQRNEQRESECRS